MKGMRSCESYTSETAIGGLHRLIRPLRARSKIIVFICGENELLGWFQKRVLPELFVGKMFVREHGYQIKRFAPGIAKSMRHAGRNTRHIWSFHGKSPIANQVLNLAV